MKELAGDIATLLIVVPSEVPSNKCSTWNIAIAVSKLGSTTVKQNVPHGTLHRIKPCANIFRFECSMWNTALASTQILTCWLDRL
jgi:hypothetical protein